MKIEEGCLAIVIDGAKCGSGTGTNVGKIVRVGKSIDPPPMMPPGAYWEVDQPMSTTWGNIFYSQLEQNLERIKEITEHDTLTVDEAVEA